MIDSPRKPWEYPSGSKVKRAGSDTWNIWANMPIAPLWKIVALHCGVDPDTASQGDLVLTFKLQPRSPEWFYQQRIDLAIAHINNGTLECFERKKAIVQSDVQLPIYAAWAESMGPGHELPPQFPRTFTKPMEGRLGAATKWPWGTHETNLLRLLAQAGIFWKPLSEGGNYDPTDLQTAPTNEQVVAWLEKQKVSTNIAKAMATILRSDDMPDGRRAIKK